MAHSRVRLSRCGSLHSSLLARGRPSHCLLRQSSTTTPAHLPPSPRRGLCAHQEYAEIPLHVPRSRGGSPQRQILRFCAIVGND
ncbi:hypothetical protein M407DRAFT_246980 [Tulasnella calospora MUT 4182]|uniref:Uncharacterized protein n=1 Tax=Tulasnella calospora MUT 4182 TaxID=1051891 RepID=A0A0C3L4A1_9AGAM|nr:hypothetical protein M407DRAFT_246980 [Tulasnella calospora MUT 4182]